MVKGETLHNDMNENRKEEQLLRHKSLSQTNLPVFIRITVSELNVDLKEAFLGAGKSPD